MSRSGLPQIDHGTEAGDHASQRLANDRVAWFTTVSASGTPQTSPIWFLWDGSEILIYSLESPRARNIVEHERVSLHLDGDGLGGDILIIEGSGRIDAAMPSAAHNADYIAKYGSLMSERDWAPEWFASRYSVPIRVRPTRFRYW